MDINKVHFDETKQSQLPFVEMLINMGYRYLPTSEVLAERGGDASKFILKNTAFKKLAEINDYEINGERYKFSEKDVREAIDELDNIQYEGLIDTSRKVYSMIMPTSGGKTIRVTHNGKSVSKNFRYIDFEHPENNDFAVAVEFEAMGKNGIRPDIVVFVNGIPFVVIENKKSSVSIEQAISQHLRNQGAEYCPKLFVYPQLLISANKEELRYGTTGTPSKFYVNWREKDVKLELINKNVSKKINKKINESIYSQLLFDLNGATYGHEQNLNRTVTEQDRSVFLLFGKDRLLDLTKNYILYDAGVKKVMRYQQYFAIKKMLDRITETEQGIEGKRRRGGLVWHTQGSGKSLTMVMFVKALIDNPHIINPRVLVVTDRKDLDRQIKTTFQNSGLKKDIIQAKSGEHLITLIKKKELRVVTTLVHKFQSASKKKTATVDPDQNIFVLIDEAHRSHSGMANLEMNKIIPNACYIAFTGTPLLKNEKSKHKFGDFIDKYTIDDALTDGIILPLIYEGRYVDLKQDRKEIDRLSDRVMDGLNDKQKYQLQKNIENRVIKDNPKRIAEIAFDIERHYLKQFKDTGLKAQIVAPSKFSAMLFQKYFDNSGKITTSLVISDENGIITDEDEHKKDVDAYLKKIKESHQSLLSYEKEVIESFKHNDDGIEILIVVDKLLTGFDAPRNTVLYLAKELRDHNLLQAIARVNRLYENKVLPKTAGYIIDYSENAQNIKTAMELFGNYDKDDVKGTLIDVKEKIEELEKNYSILHDFFKTVKGDDEIYIQYLEEEPKRKEFYDSLNTFLKSFNECMVLQDFVHEFDNLETYREELKKFMELRKTVSLRYADRVDFDKFKQSLIKIMDENIKAEEAELLTKQITITDTEAFEKAVEELGSNKSKAEAIAAQTQKTITEKLETDPIFYQKFSDKINKILEKMRKNKLADIEALKQMKLIKDEVLYKKDDTIPAKIQNKKGADIFYRNLQDEFKKQKISDEQYVEIIASVFDVLKKEAIVDWYRNNEVKRIIFNKLDDYLYDEIVVGREIKLSTEEIKKIIDKVIKLATENHQLF
ncbi:MAG: HsdR family type I site-specific deoxyribonuclease [Candidatus Pacebacteria bacterium]|nr:HsdR family type I site-specific deoxyribonuclease [Candidatus Paceibacterota bacterium]